MLESFRPEHRLSKHLYPLPRDAGHFVSNLFELFAFDYAKGQTEVRPGFEYVCQLINTVAFQFEFCERELPPDSPI